MTKSNLHAMDKPVKQNLWLFKNYQPMAKYIIVKLDMSLMGQYVFHIVYTQSPVIVTTFFLLLMVQHLQLCKTWFFDLSLVLM